MASPQKDVLVVSFIGYNTQEFPLKGKTNVTIQLSQNEMNWMQWKLWHSEHKRRRV